MDAILDTSVTQFRWSREPVIGRDGAAVAVYPTERDIEIFKLLVRFRYLPSDYIHAFVGGNEKALKPPAQSLVAQAEPVLGAAAPAAAVRRRQLSPAHLPTGRARLARIAGARPAVLTQELPPQFHPRADGRADHGVDRTWHQSKSNIRLITWPEILAHETHPDSNARVRQLRPRSVCPIRCAARRCDEIIADARPFGLERTIDGKRSYLFFPGIEADCGTEPIDAGDPERSSIAKKFAAYLAIAEQGFHRSHFGFPNFFVPFITTTAARMHSMMELLDRMTAGRGSKILLFKTFPELHLGGEAAGAERPHAHRAVAAGRLSAALSRSLICHGPPRKDHRAERPAAHHLQRRPRADDAERL